MLNINVGLLADYFFANNVGLYINSQQRRGVTCTDFDIYELVDHADHKLFTRITQPIHCLFHLLPSQTLAHCSYSLCHIFDMHNTKIALSTAVCLISDNTWLSMMLAMMLYCIFHVCNNTTMLKTF